MEQESNLPSEGVGELSVVLGRVLLKLQNAITSAVLQLRLKVVQSFTVFSVLLLLLWISAFLYGSFYYSYMPRATFTSPVHYYYRTDCESLSSFYCSYPVANVSLMRNKQHVMTFGQVYRISLQLEMPDSPTNHDLGMFMIKTTCFSEHGGQVAASARSARQLLKASSSRFGMLRYQSDLLKTLGTLLFLPAFLTGAAEQKQILDVELYSEYIDDPYLPSVTAVIEILSNKVQIYSSHLLIHAHFTGIRYLLFYYPILSALVGISTNFIFLGFLLILSTTGQLFRQKPKQLTEDEQLPTMMDNTNNQPQDENEFAAGTAEVMGPHHMDPTNQDTEGHYSHHSNDTERKNGNVSGQSEMTESEAA